jgi:HEPN domain-containing protein
MQSIRKIDMAMEQLEDALEAYFRGHYHSATVLAGAAEQLFAGYLLKYGLNPRGSKIGLSSQRSQTG